MDSVKLTQLSHGGGCGCKIAPSLLSQILAALPMTNLSSNLLVGNDTNDDAAVYRLNPEQALVATTDFFMPIVDDPFDFGRIAATNAISDIYAMGANPIFALAIVGMPMNLLSVESIQQILAGGSSVCTTVDIPIVGGHSIDAPEPIYGLVVMGLVHPSKIKRNSRSQPGDILILSKPLGIGILSAALKRGMLDLEGYRQLVDTATQLNRVGVELAELDSVHALTDVTGFGLLGHVLEICRGANLSATIEAQKLPLLPAAANFAKQGIVTGAASRNLESFGTSISFGSKIAEWQRAVMSDPQTSGGLLVAVEPSCAEQVLTLLHSTGFISAQIIGQMDTGDPHLFVV